MGMARLAPATRPALALRATALRPAIRLAAAALPELLGAAMAIRLTAPRLVGAAGAGVPDTHRGAGADRAPDLA